MANVKKFEDFIKENTENKGKGVGGDTDLIPRPTPKQTINRGDLNPVDQLGIAGRQITTDKIDGIVKSVKDDVVYVEDRLTKEIKEFSVKEFLSEFHKSYKKEKKEELEKSNESVIIEPEPELTTDDKELLEKILNVNETEKKELWEKKWENFATNYVKKMKDVDEDFEEFSENPITETISLQELSEGAIDPEEEKKEVDEKEQDGEEIKSNIEESKSDIKVQKFQSFINDRIKIKPDTIEEDMNLDEDDEETIGIAENSVPKPKPQVECVDCGQKITKNMEHIKCKDSNDFKKIMLEKTTPLPHKKIFFTSDHHFQDDRLNLYGRDLMFKDSKEVDKYIIKKWNDTVNENDLVIVIGDVSMTREGLNNIDKLNGEKWLVKGNYDISEENGGTAKYKINDEILSKYFTKVVDELELKIGNEIVYINHFPTNAKSNMFNIVGHIHGTWKVQRNMVNVGVDAWHFVPVSEDLIKFQMNGIRVHYDQNVYAGELKSNIDNRKGIVKILRAPEYDINSIFLDNEDITIFLAGPIQGAPEWQEEFINKLEDELSKLKTKRNIIISSPRRLTKKDETFVYDEQVDWESYYLDRASKYGVIVFWLPNEKEKIDGRSYAQTTRFEIGEWWAKGKNIENFNIVIGSQKGFDGMKYITKKFKDSYPDVKIHTNVEDMINDILKKIKKII